ncbi:MAG: efflux RND transporter periplasmic adaptor subunit [Candidatus Aminicenantes bacterium]|nr:efflux RND transporter periplasmic adaptor subunit [Candidatus Aminicenantes bacterium]
MKIGRILIVVFLIALVGLIGWRANKAVQAKKLEASKPAPVVVVPVETAQPTRQAIEEIVHSSGSLQSEAEVSIFSKVGGKIANNLVRMGSTVAPGQVVSIVNRDEVGYDYKPYEVRSDAKGVVSRILLNPGAAVNPSSPILNLVDVDTVKVVAAVDEKKIRFIAVGQLAAVKLEAYPGEAFGARVSVISPVANPASRTIDVELIIANPSHRLKPGMYAEVEWVQSRRNALVVPLTSVVDRGGRKFVFLAGEGQAAMIPIEIGAVVGDKVEVLSGLTGEERIITTGAGQLNDKDKIKVVEHPVAGK